MLQAAEQWQATDRHADITPEESTASAITRTVDIDGNDFWIWWALLKDGYRPRGVIIEYIGAFGRQDIVTRYAPDSQMAFARSDILSLM